MNWYCHIDSIRALANGISLAIDQEIYKHVKERQAGNSRVDKAYKKKVCTLPTLGSAQLLLTRGMLNFSEVCRVTH